MFVKIRVRGQAIGVKVWVNPNPNPTAIFRESSEKIAVWFYLVYVKVDCSLGLGGLVCNNTTGRKYVQNRFYNQHSLML